MYKKNTADLKSVKAFSTYDGLKERTEKKKTYLPMLPMIKIKKKKHLNGDISFHVNLT